MSSRFLRVTPRMEAFSLDLLGAVKKSRMCFGTVVWGVLRSWMRGISNCRLIKGEIL